MYAPLLWPKDDLIDDREPEPREVLEERGSGGRWTKPDSERLKGRLSSPSSGSEGNETPAGGSSMLGVKVVVVSAAIGFGVSSSVSPGNPVGRLSANASDILMAMSACCEAGVCPEGASEEDVDDRGELRGKYGLSS